MQEHSDILIVGGGIIGTACAYYLAGEGLSVTLIERGEIGYGCSYGNAGWIVPSHAFPLCMPGIIWQAGKWLLQPDSPLYIKPRLSSSLIRWLWRFMCSSTSRHLHQVVPALASLAKQSQQLYRQLIEQECLQQEVDYRPSGVLFVYNTEAGLRQAIHEREIIGREGVIGRVLDREGVREVEPAVTGEVIGGVYYPEECSAEPLRMVQAFARLAAERGVSLLTRTELIHLEVKERRIQRVQTTRGPMQAEQVVLATGSWSPHIARSLRLNLPIEAGKGYAITLKPFPPTPQTPLLLADTRIAVTPRRESIRLAGTLELAGLDESITRRRVDAILCGARKFLNIPPEPCVLEIWRGLRPCTPDGLPIIGKIAHFDNLWIAAGHATLGLTLGAGTGQLVADLIVGRAPSVDPAPFNPMRF
jgi:D-amino-acid dehydrogenase